MSFDPNNVAPERYFIKPPQYIRPIKKLGRNEPCRCGSGRKYKKCCIHLDELENHAAAVGLK